MKNKTIAIIDYQMSNLFSIINALNKVGITSVITSDPKVILQSDGAILPGVGSYPEAIKNLHELDLFEAIKTFIASGKPFMGICLGLQLLFNQSEEFGLSKGLAITKGGVYSFRNDSEIITVPHVGWNQIEINLENTSKMINPLKNINDGDFFYFIHSFYVDPENKEYIKSHTTLDGFRFCSSIMHENIFASQFHPEKSGKKGLQILQNFFG